MVIATFSACSSNGGSSNNPDNSSSSSPTKSGKNGTEVQGEINILTGELRPEGMLADQRPVAIMVANSKSSLPQWGVSNADVVYEMVTEGGITRLMVIFADYNTVPTVGPVRSIRDQYVQLAVPQNAILAHIGGSIYANNLLNVLGYQNIDGFYLGKVSFDYNNQMPADPEYSPDGRMNENSFFTNNRFILSGIEHMGIPTTGNVSNMFNFHTGVVLAGKEATEINIVFSVTSEAGFTYNPETGLYTKSIFGKPHNDAEGLPMQFKNVFVLNSNITLKPDERLPEFDFSEGSGHYFLNGVAQEILWKKGSPTDQLQFFNVDGSPLSVEAGKSYIAFMHDNPEEAQLSFGTAALL